jgi:hypothetical protein
MRDGATRSQDALAARGTRYATESENRTPRKGPPYGDNEACRTPSGPEWLTMTKWATIGDATYDALCCIRRRAKAVRSLVPMVGSNNFPRRLRVEVSDTYNEIGTRVAFW